MGGAVGVNDRVAFAERLPKGSVGVEIGVWQGDHARILLDVVKPEHLYLVDPWEQNYDLTNKTSTVLRSQDELDEIYGQVIERFKDDPVTVLRGRSVSVAAEWTKRVDWVYIDGIHTYEAVTADIKAWRQFTDIVCGHDWQKPGVRAAILEQLGNVDVDEEGISWIHDNSV